MSPQKAGLKFWGGIWPDLVPLHSRRDRTASAGRWGGFGRERGHGFEGALAGHPRDSFQMALDARRLQGRVDPLAFFFAGAGSSALALVGALAVLS